MTNKVEDKDFKEVTPLAPKPTESDKIWAEIQDLPIEMFALPNQVVQQHVKRFVVSPDAVYLKLKSPAVITSLEFSLSVVKGRKYSLEQAEGGYVIVKRAPMPFAIPK